MGQHVITISYSGDANFLAGSTSPSTAVTVATVPGIGFSMSNATAQSQSVVHGSAATFGFSFAPTSGAYPAAVTFAATASFSPSTIAANAGAQTVTLTLTVQTSAVAQLSRPVSPLSHRGGLIVFPLLFLPLAGTRRMHRVARKLRGRSSVALLLLLSFGAMAGLSGCGGSSKPTDVGQSQPQSYTIAVTATSGSVQLSSNVTLQVQ